MSIQVIITSFLSSVLITLVILRYQHLHGHLSADHDVDGIQKYHDLPVPRVGGLALWPAVMIGLLAFSYRGAETTPMIMLLIAAQPVWLVGLAEDISKRIGVSSRLLAATISALFAGIFFGAWILRLDCPYVDKFLIEPVFTPDELGRSYAGLASLVLTLFGVVGVTNSFNIIDGYHGLASMVGIIILLGLYYVAHQVGDEVVGVSALAVIGSIAGFMLWNYPRGSIFLGDSGAYFIGFMAAELSLLLVNRNPQVSAWFPLLLNFYPIYETLFTIFRRIVLHRTKVGMPDAAHMHQLVYRIVLRWAGVPRHKERDYNRNAMTSPYLWFLCSLAVIPAVLFWEKGGLLQAFTLVFAMSYVWIYRRIVRRKVPFTSFIRYLHGRR